MIYNMAILVVKFSEEGCAKLDRFLATNIHTQRKLLYFVKTHSAELPNLYFRKLTVSKINVIK